MGVLEEVFQILESLVFTLETLDLLLDGLEFLRLFLGLFGQLLETLLGDLLHLSLDGLVHSPPEGLVVSGQFRLELSESQLNLLYVDCDILPELLHEVCDGIVEGVYLIVLGPVVLLHDFIDVVTLQLDFLVESQLRILPLDA